MDLLNQFRFADFSETPPKSTLWLSKPRSMTRADFDAYRTSGYPVLALGHRAADCAAGIRFFADWNGFIAGYPYRFMRSGDGSHFDTVKKAPAAQFLVTRFVTRFCIPFGTPCGARARSPHSRPVNPRCGLRAATVPGTTGEQHAAVGQHQCAAVVLVAGALEQRPIGESPCRRIEHFGRVAHAVTVTLVRTTGGQ